MASRFHWNFKWMKQKFFRTKPKDAKPSKGRKLHLPAWMHRKGKTPLPEKIKGGRKDGFKRHNPFKFKLHHDKEGGRMSDTLWVRVVPVGLLAERCYVVYRPGSDHCVLIDPGAEAALIRQAAEGKHIDAILLTHGHFDHIGAVAELMDEDTQLVVHRLDAPMLTDPHLNVSRLMGEDVVCPAPTRLVEEGDAVDAAGLHFLVLHTPGHTAGSVCYQIENALFTGDTLFACGWGRTDLPTGDEKAMRESLSRLIPLRKSNTVYPGHEG